MNMSRCLRRNRSVPVLGRVALSVIGNLDNELQAHRDLLSSSVCISKAVAPVQLSNTSGRDTLSDQSL